MALLLITIKQNKFSDGVNLEKGMAVEVASKYSNPLFTNGGVEVADAFMHNYGLDARKNGRGSMLSLIAYLNVKKIN